MICVSAKLEGSKQRICLRQFHNTMEVDVNISVFLNAIAPHGSEFSDSRHVSSSSMLFEQPNSIILPISASIALVDDNPNMLFISISSYRRSPNLISMLNSTNGLKQQLSMHFLNWKHRLLMENHELSLLKGFWPKILRTQWKPSAMYITYKCFYLFNTSIYESHNTTKWFIKRFDTSSYFQLFAFMKT